MNVHCPFINKISFKQTFNVLFVSLDMHSQSYSVALKTSDAQWQSRMNLLYCYDRKQFPHETPSDD